MNNTQLAKRLCLDIIYSFPFSNGSKPYITLRNKKKIFFDVFIKKYWIDGTICAYNNQDIIRRIRIIEFLDFITKTYDISYEENGVYIIKSYYYTIVCKKSLKKENTKWQLISIYPHL